MKRAVYLAAALGLAACMTRTVDEGLVDLGHASGTAEPTADSGAAQTYEQVIEASTSAPPPSEDDGGWRPPRANGADGAVPEGGATPFDGAVPSAPDASTTATDGGTTQPTAWLCCLAPDYCYLCPTQKGAQQCVDVGRCYLPKCAPGDYACWQSCVDAEQAEAGTSLLEANACRSAY